MTTRLHRRFVSALAAAAVLALASAPAGMAASSDAMHHAMMHHAMKCRRHAKTHKHAMGHCPTKHRR